MVKQHYSISNYDRGSSSSLSMDTHSLAHQDSQLRAHSDPGPDLNLAYPTSSPSSPATQVFNPNPTVTPPTQSISPNPIPSTDQNITDSLPATLKLTRNIIAALNTYIAKMRADLTAIPPRVPAIAIYEIRCAERYQSILKMKARRMEIIQVVLDKHLAERREVNVKWEEGSQELWAQELEYVRRARKYLIGSHVFYKINYELAK